MSPLADRRILITRAPHQASELAERLSALGAIPIFIPTIEIAPPSSYDPLDGAVGDAGAFELVVFTSANAVHSFEERAQLLGVAPAPKRIAVVGPATARAVEAMGLGVDVMPALYTAEALGAKLAPEVRGRRVLLVLAEDAPRVLRAALEGAGAEVTVAAAYRNRIPAGSPEAVGALFGDVAGHPDAVTFTSASTAVNLVALLEAAGIRLPEAVIRASIGPVTSGALRELGLPPHIEAAQATIPALVEALAGHFEGRPESGR
jgi:uroporphyrinogen-III synthase